ncbi:MAG TPA: mechanosensitive ion channel domain-containing protein [Pseudolysinimonas sp.]|jgi:small conductance mechanosensitive channel|nr:mechanosensitive ion channel domain-containing protein [Pseudolysinimonas sp.]
MSWDWDAFWTTVAGFLAGPWGIPLRILLIVVISVLIRGALHIVIGRIVNRVVNGVKRKHNVDDTQALQHSPVHAARVVQRTRALGGVLNSVVTTVVVLTAMILVISVAAPEATAAFSLITAALGAGLGFGAQNVVKDVLNGLFMVSEDQLGVGDVVDLGPATGVVEAVGIRITQVRDVNGTLWFVRNGEILRVGNLSQGWARVIIDLAVPYEADVDAVQTRMLETAVALREEPKWRRLIIERPEIWGIESVSAEAIVIRLVVKVRAGSKDDVARELRGRLKRALDEMGVKLPKLNSIVLSGYDGAASVRGARPPKTAQLPVAMRPAKEAATTQRNSDG